MKNKEATSVAIDREGWLHTGDLCYIDMRGLVYVVDRIKELIKYKAYQVLFCSAFDDEHSICQFQPMLAWALQVSPAELEEVLSTHPDVLDVAVTW